MKPDYGYFLFESTKNRGPHIFYDVLIPNIDQIDQTLYMTTVNKIEGGVEYYISFDIPETIISKLLDCVTNTDDKNKLTKLVEKGVKFQYDLNIPVNISTITCQIGDLFLNQNEVFRPLVVTAIN